MNTIIHHRFYGFHSACMPFEVSKHKNHVTDNKEKVTCKSCKKTKLFNSNYPIPRIYKKGNTIGVM